jgi:hypothetical protein
MHNEADLELRLLRAAHSDLNRRAVRYTQYDPTMNDLVSRVIAEHRQPHPVVEVVPMNRRICRVPNRTHSGGGLIGR